MLKKSRYNRTSSRVRLRYNKVMDISAHILIIEDDADINDVMATYLQRQGFSCTQAFSGSEARLVLDAPPAERPFDLVITDLMLPGVPGHELVAHIRRNAPTPIIVVSAQDAPHDKVALLSSGADDYLVKPFSLEELLARVQVQLRHVAQREDASPAQETIRFKEWSIDTEARTLTVKNQIVPLTRTEFNLIEALARHPKKAFTKQELFARAWNEECFAEEKAVNVHMSNVRTKLKPTGTDTYIQTVWGVGFKLAE